jgi:hypothetical protein
MVNIRKSDLSRKKNALENFLIEANKKFKGKFDYSFVKYTGMLTNCKIICPVHGEFYQRLSRHLSNEFGCPKCSHIEFLNGSFRKFIIKANEIHENKYDYSKSIYLDSRKNIEIICNKHGSFNQIVCNHLAGMGCPICRESRGEERVRRWLKKNKINFISQYRFNDCRRKNPLPFDFYLPYNNICIEYNGRQHYEKNSFFSAKEGKESDKIKKNYCKKNKIKLLIIPHFKMDKTEKMLLNFVL